MKNFITFLLLFLTCSANFHLTAQANYYPDTKTFYENGYTYQCDVNEASMVYLYNADYTYCKTEQIDLTTGKRYEFVPGKPPLAREPYTKPKCFAIVNKAFPPEIKARINGRELSIVLYIESATGKIADVVFNFTTQKIADIYTQVPVSVYREIEVELKKNVQFTPSDVGKNLNYIFMFWKQDPNVTIKDTIDTPPELEIVPDDDEYRRENPPFIKPTSKDEEQE